MTWIIGIIALVVFVLLMVQSKGFRIVAGIGFVVIVIAIVALIAYQNRKAEIARTLIGIDDIEIRELSLSGGSNLGSSESYTLEGTVKNNSAYELTYISFRITFYDCPEKKDVNIKECDIIADESESAFLSIPPGQVRSFDESLFVRNLPQVKGRFVWGHEITEIVGHE